MYTLWGVYMEWLAQASNNTAGAIEALTRARPLKQTKYTPMYNIIVTRERHHRRHHHRCRRRRHHRHFAIVVIIGLQNRCHQHQRRQAQ